MKEIVNVALIGCSDMGKIHADGVIEYEGARLYAICDTASERLDGFKELYSPVRAVSDYKLLLDDEELDAVIIVTPDQLHKEMVCAFLRAKKAVLCEKPMALTVKECEDMMLCEKECDGRLMIGQVCRFTPAFVKAKELIDEGVIGELVFVESEYAHNYTHARGYNDWRVVPERHGFIGGGCHAVDLLRWIAGDPIEVYSYSSHKCLTDWPQDDTAIAIYKFPNNVAGKVFVSTGCKRNYTMRSVFYGTLGTIICDNKSPTFQLFVDDGEIPYTTPREIPVDINNHNAKGEIKCFLDALINDLPMPVSSIDGASTVAACCAAVESSKLGKPIDIIYPKV